LGRYDALSPSRRASFPSLGGTADATASSLPQGADALCCGPGLWSPGAQPGLGRGDLRVLPGSWATLSCTCPGLIPRRTRGARPIRRRGCCLPFTPRRRLPDSVSRGWLPRPAHSLSTLRSGGLPRRDARLASGGWPTLAG